jgi:hypothetical protein
MRRKQYKQMKNKFDLIVIQTITLLILFVFIIQYLLNDWFLKHSIDFNAFTNKISFSQLSAKFELQSMRNNSKNELK